MKFKITLLSIFFILIAQIANGAVIPNDPYFSNQWYLFKVEANDAWEIVRESPEVVIAVIDSGIQIDHPDLKNNIWTNIREIAGDNIDNDGNGFIDDLHGWDFVNNVPDPSPKIKDGWTESGISHGTMVAGIIAAEGNNREGVSGLLWRTKIMPLKALNDRGEGKISDAIRAIDYAINNGADIINLSFSSSNYSEALQEAIYRAHRAGVIVVAAAGNEQIGNQGENTDLKPVYPACYDGHLIGENMVIGVAATDALDQKTSFSGFGSCVDISAPGISFFNTLTNYNIIGADKDYDGYWSGTSMAAPLVSATLALIKEANPELNQRQVVNILFASADNINALNPNYPGQLGNGRLNVKRAVEMAKNALHRRFAQFLINPLDVQLNEKNNQIEVSNKENSKIKKQLNAEEEIAKAPDYDKDMIVAKLINPQGNLVEFLPNLESNFNIVVGDIDADGHLDLVLGSAKGAGGIVKVLDKNGKEKFKLYPYGENFSGGINVSLADFNDDGRLEIVLAPASEGPAEIKILDYKGNLKNSFYVADKNWRGGLSLAVGDLDGKGRQQIVAGFSAGHEPQLRIADEQGRLLGIFLAYEKEFRGGVNVAVANLDGNKDRSKAEIIVSPGAGREPLIKIFDHHASLKNQFLGFDKSWQKGVAVLAGDIDNDGVAEIILSAYPGGSAQIRIFNLRGNILESYYVYPENYNAGIRTSFIMTKVP